ncbi:alpha/beta fold hydrolase [Evansella sp. AB-rgal1]|uniref:alpha/beta fold hydrolase n=1 Tax=Evansella sp. AB-rgal1 TaxID=3242696 RepID=UPI00359CCEA3
MKGTTLEKEKITLSGVNVFCEYVLNGKPPIVLIHGFVSSTYTFHRIIPLLEEQFSVLAIDLPGFGRSEKSTSFIYSFENYAKLILECMDYFRFESAHMVGHSMGGQIALYTAKIAPHKITKLILLCSSGYLKRAKNYQRYSTYLPFFHVFVERYIKRKDIQDYLKNVLYNSSYMNEDLFREYGRPLSDKNFYKSLARLLRYREGDLPSDQLKTIETPTLLLWGEEDKVVPLEVGKKLVEDLPNAKIKTFEKTGHLLTEERPKELYEQIIAYAL